MVTTGYSVIATCKTTTSGADVAVQRHVPTGAANVMRIRRLSHRLATQLSNVVVSLGFVTRELCPPPPGRTDACVRLCRPAFCRCTLRKGRGYLRRKPHLHATRCFERQSECDWRRRRQVSDARASALGCGLLSPTCILSIFSPVQQQTPPPAASI